MQIDWLKMPHRSLEERIHDMRMEAEWEAMSQQPGFIDEADQEMQKAHQEEQEDLFWREEKSVEDTFQSHQKDWEATYAAWERPEGIIGKIVIVRFRNIEGFIDCLKVDVFGKIGDEFRGWLLNQPQDASYLRIGDEIQFDMGQVVKVVAKE